MIAPLGVLMPQCPLLSCLVGLLLGACATPVSATPVDFPYVGSEVDGEAAAIPNDRPSDESPLVASSWRSAGLATSSGVPAVGSTTLPGQKDADGADEGWRLRFTPYVWATSINGSLTVKGVKADVDASFADLMENVDYAVQGAFVASNNEGFHFMADWTYIALDVDNEVGGSDVEAGGYISIAQAAVAHDINSDPTLAAFVGVRRYDMSIRPSITPPGVSAKGSQTWYDPIVGLRKIFPLEGPWAIHAIGDVGGKLGGHSSDLTWQAAVLGVRRTDYGNLVLGYRVLFVDYEDGSGPSKFAFDNTLFGPMIGWVFRF